MTSSPPTGCVRMFLTVITRPLSGWTLKSSALRSRGFPTASRCKSLLMWFRDFPWGKTSARSFSSVLYGAQQGCVWTSTALGGCEKPGFVVYGSLESLSILTVASHWSADGGGGMVSTAQPTLPSAFLPESLLLRFSLLPQLDLLCSPKQPVGLWQFFPELYSLFSATK